MNNTADHFNLLAQPGNVGFYTRCEVIEIFGVCQNLPQPFNIFTIVVFEDSTRCTSDSKFLTHSLSMLSKSNIKWGILQRIISVDVSKILFMTLLEEKKYKINGNELRLGNIIPIHRYYVQPDDSFVHLPINNLLKNNHHSGSHIIEFFDVSKEHNAFLLAKPETLNKLSEKISEIIPIRIGNVSDRLGNIIFQFPINVVKIYHRPIAKDLCGENVVVLPHEKFDRTVDLHAYASTSQDDVTIDAMSQKINLGENHIRFNTDGIVKIKIFDQIANLTFFEETFTALKNIAINIDIQHTQNRVFFIDKQKHELPVVGQQNFDVVPKTEADPVRWSHNRKYSRELKQLENNKSFVQYHDHGTKGNDQQRALGDVRSLIHQYGRNGVYLWDPYLSADDIKKTLFFCPYIDIPMRAITGLMDIGVKKKQEIFDCMKAAFESENKNYLFMELEVRGCINVKNHWHKFHDRFLIFPQEKPKAWSLGISINQLGRSHHIIQEIEHSQHILNAFNELWDALATEGNIIWKST